MAAWYEVAYANSIPFGLGIFWKGYYWIRDKMSGTTTKLDGSIVDTKTNAVIRDSSGNYSAVPNLPNDTKKRINWRSVVSIALGIVAVLVFIKLLKTVGLSDYLINKFKRK